MSKNGFVNKYTSISLFIVLLLSLPATTAAYQQDVTANNISRYIGNGRYDWTIFLVASEATLNQITYVEYTLHPTFPNPKRRVSQRQNRDYPFALSSNGWGEFNIGVKVAFNNGKVVEFDYHLKLEKNRTK